MPGSILMMLKRVSHPPSQRGFTLLELVAVVGVVAVLLSILLPALARSRRAAQSLGCLNNLRSLGQAMAMYRHENDGLLPFADRAPDVRIGWMAPFDALANQLDISAPHLSNRGDILSGPPFICPSDSSEAVVLGTSYFYTPFDMMGGWSGTFAQRAVTLWLETDPTVVIMVDSAARHEGIDESIPMSGRNALLFEGSVRAVDATLSVNPRH